MSSPWDLVKVGDSIYIAMAGTHQIWKLDLKKKQVFPFAGSGAEERFDSFLRQSGFAQPSGIASDGKYLWVADSESNIIREIDLQNEFVKTLAGGDLWDFGDRDGTGNRVRLQHPLGIVVVSSKLLIADTYNHKIKELFPANQTVRTFLGNGKAGQTDGAKPQFYEPGGLSAADGKLFIADTNNHAVRVVDLETKLVSTLKIAGLRPPENVFNAETAVSPNLQEFRLKTINVSAGSEGKIVFNLELPEGFHLNVDAPNRFEVTAENGNLTVEKPKGDSRKFHCRFHFRRGQAKQISAKFTFYYCRDDNTGECLIKTFLWKVPVSLSRMPLLPFYYQER